MKKVVITLFLTFCFSVNLAWASHPYKDIGVDYPNSIILGGTGNSPFQAVQGDIDGNGSNDLIVIGSTEGVVGGNKIYVGVFYDATLSSLNNRNFSAPDFLIKTSKQYPWSSDVVKFHTIHWLAVGDLNQDGFDDIVFGLPIIDLGGGSRDEKGEVYIVLGDTREHLGSLWDFSVKPPSFTLYGKDSGDRAGFSVATGDINGDGRDDLVIGAPQADGPNNSFPNGGEIYALTYINFAQSSMVLEESTVNLYLYGETGQQYGYAVTTGNLNGDTNPYLNHPLEDIIVAPYISPSGPVKMVFGSPTISGTKRLSIDADWTSSYGLIPRHPNLTTGDLNRDGIDDLSACDAGDASYFTYGSTGIISATPDVTIDNSAHLDDNLGFSNFFSDFDGDGFNDLAILAPRARGEHDQYTIPVGEAHILWGQATHLPSTINLATETTHFSLYGNDGTGPTGLSSNFQGAWNSTYGYVFGMELEGGGTNTELLFGGSWNQNSYLYHIGPRQQGGGGCFLAGTPVLMADGTMKPIEKIKRGDRILAFDEQTRTFQKDRVKRFAKHEVNEYLVVNGHLNITPNQPVYSNGKWIEMGSLKIGGNLLNSQGNVESITSIQKVHGKVRVYDLEVNPYHTYIAGGVVVHNKKIPLQAEPGPR